MKKFWQITIILIGLIIIVGCGSGHDDDHEHGDLPYEWSGEYSFDSGIYVLEFMESGDPSCDAAFIINEGDMEDIAHLAHHIMEEEMAEIQPDEQFTVIPDYGYTLVLNPEQTTIFFEITEAGEYIVFLEHLPEEFGLKILDGSGNEIIAKNPVEYEDD